MRARLIRYLKVLVRWLERDDEALLVSARAIVKVTDGIQRATKRQTQLVRILTAQKLLARQFPEAKIRDVNFAIERALQESK